MSPRRNKRRRVEQESVIAVDSDEIAPSSSPARDAQTVETSASAQDHLQEAPFNTEVTDIDILAKEQEIWDTFREEQYEVLEQLPLSLHRAFTLIQELDQQCQEHVVNLTPAILKYVSLRRALAESKPEQGSPSSDGNVAGANGNHEATDHASDMNGKMSNGSSLSPPPASTPGPASSSRSRTTPAPTRSLAAVVQSSDSTRELLVSIAQSSEDISRASNEKYYLARHVYDLVDRYIRDLDRAIKEQEASISLGLRPGTHPASIILPEVIVPKANRNRPASSPPPMDFPFEPAPIPPPTADPLGESAHAPPLSSLRQSFPDQEAETDVEIVEPMAAAEFAQPRGKRKGKKRRKTLPAPSQSAVGLAEDQEIIEIEDDEPKVEVHPPLTLKIPAQNMVPLAETEVADPNEPRYCFCNQVSYGEMIACDNPTCEREWFHMGCVGLTRIPKGKWYCRDCVDLKKRPKGKKKAR